MRPRRRGRFPRRPRPASVLMLLPDGVCSHAGQTCFLCEEATGGTGKWPSGPGEGLLVAVGVAGGWPHRPAPPRRLGGRGSTSEQPQPGPGVQGLVRQDGMRCTSWSGGRHARSHEDGIPGGAQRGEWLSLLEASGHRRALGYKARMCMKRATWEKKSLTRPPIQYGNRKKR